MYRDISNLYQQTENRYDKCINRWMGGLVGIYTIMTDRYINLNVW